MQTTGKHQRANAEQCALFGGRVQAGSFFLACCLMSWSSFFTGASLESNSVDIASTVNAADAGGGLMVPLDVVQFGVTASEWLVVFDRRRLVQPVHDEVHASSGHVRRLMIQIWCEQ